jgi:ATP/maltotriose-dependent transcriptional regulator MalT
MTRRASRDKTQRWPAAVELAALALDDSVDPAVFVAQVAGSHSSVVDYLGDVLVSRLDVRILRVAGPGLRFTGD